MPTFYSYHVIGLSAMSIYAFASALLPDSLYKMLLWPHIWVELNSRDRSHIQNLTNIGTSTAYMPGSTHGVTVRGNHPMGGTMGCKYGISIAILTRAIREEPIFSVFSLFRIVGSIFYLL